MYVLWRSDAVGEMLEVVRWNTPPSFPISSFTSLRSRRSLVPFFLFYSPRLVFFLPRSSLTQLRLWGLASGLLLFESLQRFCCISCVKMCPMLSPESDFYSVVCSTSVALKIEISRRRLTKSIPAVFQNPMLKKQVASMFHWLDIVCRFVSYVGCFLPHCMAADAV